MNPHQIIAVSVRLAAIWLYLYAVSTMTGVYVQADKSASLWPFFMGFGIITAICCLLWFFPFFIAKSILPKSETKIIQTPLFDDWFSVSCSLIGLFVLSKAIPALISYSLVKFLWEKLFRVSFEANPDWILMFCYNIFHVVFGLWFFLGGKGLKKILNWTRSR